MSIMKRLGLAAVAVGLMLGAARETRAGLVLYTFEAPRFTVGQAIPMVNVAPNSGDPSFLASFTSPTLGPVFRISPFQPNGLFSGNSLFEPTGFAGNTLTITLNQPITSLSLVFATNGAGSISLSSAAGGVTVTSTPQLGGSQFAGGTLNFTGSTAFSSFSLTEVAPTGGLVTEFAIDNLAMNSATVPEPSSLALSGVAGLVGLGYARARRQRATA